jgi:hypothetical protein
MLPTIRKLVWIAIVLILEAKVVAYFGSGWESVVALIVGLLFLAWTCDLMPHMGMPVLLRLSDLDGDTAKVIGEQKHACTLAAGKTETSVNIAGVGGRRVKKSRIRYYWEPKSEVSAHVDGELLR